MTGDKEWQNQPCKCIEGVTNLQFCLEHSIGLLEGAGGMLQMTDSEEEIKKIDDIVVGLRDRLEKISNTERQKHDPIP